MNIFILAELSFNSFGRTLNQQPDVNVPAPKLRNLPADIMHIHYIFVKLLFD